MISSVPVAQTAPADVGRVAHGHERLRGGGVAHDPVLEEADRAGRVGALGEGEGEEGQAHADEDDLAVADLAPRGDHHQLAVGERPGRRPRRSSSP